MMRLILRFSAVILIGTPILSWGQNYTINTYAGGGNSNSSGIPATQEQVVPGGVAVDAAGNVYLTESFSNAAFVSKVSPNGIITTIAGDPSRGTGFSGDGGPATNAQFDFIGLPAGIAVDSQGNVYVVDRGNNRVRRIDSKGIVTTVAGGGTLNLTTFGDGGPATAAYFVDLVGVSVDSGGNLYISSVSAVRKVDSSGTITTVAGCASLAGNCFINYFTSGSIGDGGAATSAYLQPVATAIDSAGNLFIADQVNNRIRKVSAGGVITTIAGSASGSFSGDGGAATSAGLGKPTGVAVDAAGNVYIDDNGDYRIRMVTAGGTISTIGGNGAAGQPFTIAQSGVPATAAMLGMTNGLAVGPSGQLYIADDYFGIRVLTSGNNPPTGGTGDPPAIASGGIVSASAFGGSRSVAPGSWIEIYGSNLAANTRGWAGSDFNATNAPTSLDGTSVTIAGQPAFVAYISPGQVNAQVPSGVPTGSQPLIVKTSSGSSSTININIDSVQPGLLAPSSFNVNGTQYAVAFFPDGSFDLPSSSVPGVSSHSAKSGDTVTFYGVGFGATTPSYSAGQIVQQSNTLTQSFKINFGATPATVVYNGLAPGLVGVYQFNVVVPTLGSSNFIPLTFSLNGVTGTQTLYTGVQN